MTFFVSEFFYHIGGLFAGKKTGPGIPDRFFQFRN
jgi:hypothetical protein